MKIPQIRRYNLIHYPIDLISYKLIKHKFNIQDTIIIAGTPRGGTTWFMELLETLPEYKSIFEPFNKKWFPGVKKLNLPPRPYLEPDTENNPLKDYLNLVFTGQTVSRAPRFSLTPRSIKKRLLATKVVVKFIRANRLLPWIINNFKIRATYFLLRHPCATIASQLETGARGYFIPKSASIPKETILKEASQIPQIKENEWLMKKLTTIQSPEEILATIWSLDNYVPLLYLSRHPNAWYTTTYEKLITDFDEEIEKVFEYINEEVPDEVYEKFRKPSATTHDKSHLGTSKQLTKWKKKLSTRQVKNILKVIHWFGLDFYTEHPEPDYDKLRNWKP
ncbi:sulfotransferase domain-containing protein [Thermococcus argininiproducens]|uniref:Sulfotransferase domain-containing protein n=1 Tax=Thermococcus argininiproducens TaxID=2866384 RepID=A0A9E7MAX5_9EURY|nr:sulfotransferase domain-containing protein [Thermococcus argininiproducens]USH00419.1 sulfotransferase domain-containing protein [Thermococcus argininiproducens]